MGRNVRLGVLWKFFMKEGSKYFHDKEMDRNEMEVFHERRIASISFN